MPHFCGLNKQLLIVLEEESPGDVCESPAGTKGKICVPPSVCSHQDHSSHQHVKANALKVTALAHLINEKTRAQRSEMTLTKL